MFRKLISVSDLKTHSSHLNRINRHQIPIIIIDDNKFEYKAIIQNHDLTIKKVEGIDAQTQRI